MSQVVNAKPFFRIRSQVAAWVPKVSKVAVKRTTEALEQIARERRGR